jgi:ligand-binding sensor domain-containing protein/signal transduction histidine kinase
MAARISLLVLVLLGGGVASAQTGAIIDRWGVQQGLPNNALASVLQTRDGYLWIATWAGIVRFDGVRFTRVAANLPNDHARVLFEDRDGAVWIGVAGTGLSRWRESGVQTFTPATGLAGSDVRAIVQDGAGRIWAGTENGVSIIDAHGGVRTLHSADGLPDDAINALSTASDGGVWVATPRGVCHVGADTQRCTADAAIDGRVDAIIEDRAGRLWAGTPDGISVIGDESEHPACRGSCLRGEAITALLQTRDGDLWAGLGTSGVARIDAHGIERFGVAQGLPAGSIVGLREDAEGSIWVAVYNGGLARIKRKRVTTLSTDDGLPAQVVGSIVQDRNGDIWAGTQCGAVSILTGTRFVPQFAAAMRGACAWVLWPARDGALWIGTRGSGLYRWADGRLDHFGAPGALSDGHIAALFEDRDGTIWIGTEFGGVHTFSHGTLSRSFDAKDGVATGYVASFAQDRDGRVWIGSNANGLSVFEHGRFRILPPEESPPTRNIAGLLVDSRGDLWIGSAASGLFRRRNGRYQPFGIEQGLGDRLVAVMIEDTDANLWVGTAHGISRLSRERIEAVAAGRAASLDPIIVDRSDGMRNTEGSGGGLDPSGMRDRDGRLWFSTIDGIAVIDPKSFATNRVAPPVVVEDTVLDNQPARKRADGSIEVPAGTTAIEVAYTAFSFVAPAKVRFKYRLRGYEPAWHDAGPRRAAYYSRLPPGHYTLEVMAANNDGVWSTAPATLQLSVLPFLWERPVVQLAGLGFLLIATGVIVNAAAQRRARRRVADLERERALERVRTRIARDLHDDLGSRLAQIALMTDRGAGADQVSGALRTAVESLDELVWTVNSRHDTTEGFAAYAARFAEEHVGAAGLRLRLHIPADLPALEFLADTRRHMFLAFKEAVNNAVKHSGATEIHVGLTLDGPLLCLEVADNGRGLHGEGDPTGNGLSNMRERMAGVGGSVAFEQRPGGGLRVILRAPVELGGDAAR